MEDAVELGEEVDVALVVVVITDAVVELEGGGVLTGYQLVMLKL